MKTLQETLNESKLALKMLPIKGTAFEIALNLANLEDLDITMDEYVNELFDNIFKEIESLNLTKKYNIDKQLFIEETMKYLKRK